MTGWEPENPEHHRRALAVVSADGNNFGDSYFVAGSFHRNIKHLMLTPGEYQNANK